MVGWRDTHPLIRRACGQIKQNVTSENRIFRNERSSRARWPLFERNHVQKRRPLRPRDTVAMGCNAIGKVGNALVRTYRVMREELALRCITLVRLIL